MNALQEIVNRSKKLAFFGGAGVSTASGIPDFRSEGGLFAEKYRGLTPEMILSASFFYMHPDIFYEYYHQFMLHPQARPNAAHRKLCELERAGKITGIVTQNIDGLHKMAGNRLVYEIHGTVHENHCMDCGRFFGFDFMVRAKGVPKCPDCGCIIKPDVTLYGEAPNKYSMTGACREISAADTLIVAGTSLAVEPAASCLTYFHGKNLVVINREETPADGQASLVLRGDVSRILDELVVES